MIESETPMSKRHYETIKRFFKALFTAPFAICAAIFVILWNALCFPVASEPRKHIKKIREGFILLKDSLINPPFFFLRFIFEFIADLRSPRLDDRERKKITFL